MAEASFDIAAARANLRARNERRRVELRKRFEAATADFERIVRRLIKTYNPRRIWQWGSLLDERKFTEVSDIDIGVEGLRGAQEYFAACATAEECTEFAVDLIELERIEPEFADLIRQLGRVVYERPEQP